MDSTERTGLIVSGVGHGALILWALVGGLFNHEDDPAAISTTEVSLISSAEFDAMVAAAPRAETALPDQPNIPEAEPVEAAPEPVEEVPPETEATPVAEPPPAEEAPDVSQITPPEAEVTDVPPELTPPSDEPVTTVLPTPNTTPQAAPRLAPTPTEAPAPEAEVADAVTAEVSEAPTETPVEEPPEEEAAPEEAGQVLETEANKEQVEIASAAPAVSARPKSRPEKPAVEEAPVAEAPAEEAAPSEPEPEPAPADAEADAVAEALAAAMAGGEEAPEAQAGTGTAASGPPMTGGEKDALIVAVKQCWNTGSLSTDALNTIVTVGVSMNPDGTPNAGSIRMIGAEGGTDASARQAFEAGRRAIMRCGARGFPLPPEKFDQWKEIEIVFNPEKMRLR
ncbi:MAG: hypothetical protein RLZZ528_1653 [Pseudomonadota bacterium]